MTRDRFVGLREHDEGFGAAVMSDHEQPLETSGRKWAVETVYDSDKVDIGGEHLLDILLRWVTATDTRLAGEDPHDDRPESLFLADLDPVTGDRRNLVLRSHGIGQHPNPTVGGDDITLATVHTYDPTESTIPDLQAGGRT